MSDGRRWDVFLAYASPDRDRARVLYQALAGAGLSVCFDEAVLRPGDNWHRMLPEHLRSSAVLVVLVSSHTPAAAYENEEVVMILDEARHTADPVHLMRVFGIADRTAMHYVSTAHPERRSQPCRDDGAAPDGRRVAVG
ncbi:MAG: toll/interleukin-1 receptor domain-containing protein [Acidimicrobiales bacterium]